MDTEEHTWERDFKEGELPMEAKWEDTIMKLPEMNQVVLTYSELPMGQALVNAQAQISFEAGKQEGMIKVVEKIKNIYKNTNNPKELKAHIKEYIDTTTSDML